MSGILDWSQKDNGSVAEQYSGTVQEIGVPGEITTSELTVSIAANVGIKRRQFEDNAGGLFTSLINRQLGFNLDTTSGKATIIWKDENENRHDWAENVSDVKWEDGNAGFIKPISGKGVELVSALTSTSTANFTGSVSGGSGIFARDITSGVPYVTALQTGWSLNIDAPNDILYVDHKAKDGRNIVYRCGGSSELGSQRAWLNVESENGNVNFTGMITGNEKITCAGFFSTVAQNTDSNALVRYDTLSDYVPISRILTAGTGLTGGGNLSADRTFNVDTTVIAERLWVTGLPVSTFSNDSGYITSYTETDTLDSVTSRGAVTTNTIEVGGIDLKDGSLDLFEDSTERGFIKYDPNANWIAIYNNQSNSSALPSFTAYDSGYAQLRSFNNLSTEIVAYNTGNSAARIMTWDYNNGITANSTTDHTIGELEFNSARIQPSVDDGLDLGYLTRRFNVGYFSTLDVDSISGENNYNTGWAIIGSTVTSLSIQTFQKFPDKTVHIRLDFFANTTSGAAVIGLFSRSGDIFGIGLGVDIIFPLLVLDKQSTSYNPCTLQITYNGANTIVAYNTGNFINGTHYGVNHIVTL